MTELYTYQEAADYLRVNVNTLRHWVSAGKISHLKYGKLVRFSQEDIDSFLQTCRRDTVASAQRHAKTGTAGGFDSRTVSILKRR